MRFIEESDLQQLNSEVNSEAEVEEEGLTLQDWINQSRKKEI